jgi:hypothetical protein
MTRAVYLEKIINEVFPDDKLEVEFRPFQGWYMVGLPRHFGDDGSDFLGKNWREAELALRWMQG